MPPSDPIRAILAQFQPLFTTPTWKKMMTLFGHALYPHGQLPLKQAAWYHKQAATFGDVLAVVRRHLWGNFTFPTSPADPDVVLVPRSTLSRLAQAVCY